MSRQVVYLTDEQWRKIEPLIPKKPVGAKGGRPRADDRLWDRYRRRYIVERTFSWITDYRRVVVRYENHISMFVAFFQLGCVMITLRKRL